MSTRQLVTFWTVAALYLLVCAALWYGAVRLFLWVLP